MTMGNAIRHRVCILGSEASGKTCFIGALAVLGQVEGSIDFKIYAPQDSHTQNWLNTLARLLKDGSWPPSTPDTRLYDFILEYGGAALRITLMDYSGEAFRRGFDDLDPESLADLQKHVLDADTILILLDPLADLGILGGEEGDGAVREQRLSALFNTVLKYSNTGTDKNMRTSKNVALLVTKSDLVPTELRDAGAERLVRQAVPKFYATVRDNSVACGCFFISAVGGDHSGTGPMPAPPSPIRPQGYGDLFKWMVSRRNQARMKKFFWKALPFAVVALLVLAGEFFYENRMLAVLNDPSASEKAKSDASKKRYILMKKNVEIIVSELMSSRIDDIRVELGDASTFESLNRLRSRLEELRDYGNHTYSYDMDGLSGDIDRKLEDLYFARIRGIDSSEGKKEACDEYLKQYPQGRYVDDVHRILAELGARSDRDARQKINLIVPGTIKRNLPDFLLRKAAAVDGYRKEHAEQHLRERMERASRLASKLASERNYAITIHSAEELAAVYSTQMIVRDGKREDMAKSEMVDDMTPRWGTRFNLSWQPGDKIEIEWRYTGWWPDGPIAVRSDDELDSLKILSGKVELVPDAKKDLLNATKKTLAVFSVDGIEDGAWQDFHDFIYPGNYWQR